MLNTFGCKLKLEQWAEGIYFFPEGFNTGLAVRLRSPQVAINKLPDNPATLWLRILGKGTKQKQAIQQLLELPETNSLRNQVLQEIVNWRIVVDNKQNVTDEEKEWIMSLSPAYVKWREDTLQEGRQEGRQEGQRLVLENLLKVRFGQMDSALASIISPLLKLPSEESARLLIELSRSELLTRFESDRFAARRDRI